MARPLCFTACFEWSQRAQKMRFFRPELALQNMKPAMRSG